MARSKALRKKLGTRASFVARYSLWLADDHLLAVRSIGFEEHYKRFYLRDLQALTLRKTNDWMILNLTLFVILLAFISVGMMVAEPDFWLFASFVVVPVFFFLVASLIRGRSAHLWAQTAAQTERLEAIGRFRRGRKVIDQLIPLIAAAQAGAPVPPPPEDSPDSNSGNG